MPSIEDSPYPSFEQRVISISKELVSDTKSHLFAANFGDGIYERSIPGLDPLTAHVFPRLTSADSVPLDTTSSLLCTV